MYPIQCHAGYYIPIKAGKFEIVGFEALASDTTAAATIKLIDDETIKTGAKVGNVLSSSYDLQPGLLYDKAIANGGALMGRQFSEPIKVRHGLSAVNTTNCVAGNIIVWVK